MQAVKREAATLGTLCERVVQRKRGLFQSKETRDAVAKQLSSEGYGVRRTSVRGQQLHPEYITDYVGTYFTGFGNTDYQTFWSVLYEIVVL